MTIRRAWSLIEQAVMTGAQRRRATFGGSPGRLAVQEPQGSSPYFRPPPGTRVTKSCGFLHGCSRLKFSPHACAARALTHWTIPPGLPPVSPFPPLTSCPILLLLSTAFLRPIILLRSQKRRKEDWPQWKHCFLCCQLFPIPAFLPFLLWYPAFIKALECECFRF